MKKSPVKKLPQISEAEYEVMKIVWKSAPISTTEIWYAPTWSRTSSPGRSWTL